MTQLERGRLREALAAFRRATALRPDDGEAWFDLGSTAVLFGERGEAEKAFRNAARLKSVAAPEARNNLGVLLAYKGDLAAAESEFNAALAEAGGNMPEAQNNLRLCRSMRASAVWPIAREFEFGVRKDQMGEV